MWLIAVILSAIIFFFWKRYKAKRTPHKRYIEDIKMKEEKACKYLEQGLTVFPEVGPWIKVLKRLKRLTKFD